MQCSVVRMLVASINPRRGISTWKSHTKVDIQPLGLCTFASNFHAMHVVIVYDCAMIGVAMCKLVWSAFCMLLDSSV